MKAIRGAVTISEDSPSQIRAAVRELLDAVCQKNSLTKDNLICILFSNTEDIRSLYPAKAAREAGYSSVPLYSSAEPTMEDSLPLCIRVLIFAESDLSIPVYLGNAASLRPDLKKFAVALDGPSGSGKSTVAKFLAKEYDILYLDTGAMYRACALKAIRENLSDINEESVFPLMRNLNLRIEYKEGSQHTILDEIDVSEDIRRPEVSMAASRISALRCVREKMVEMQRLIASKQSCVLDGRDIGSFVLPDAEFKFYVTAASSVRAKRRFDELKAKGYDVDLNALQEEIEQRDHNDSTREFSPLRRAEDAVLVDTSDMNVEEVVAYIKSKIQERI